MSTHNCSFHSHGLFEAKRVRVSYLGRPFDGRTHGEGINEHEVVKRVLGFADFAAVEGPLFVPNTTVENCHIAKACEFTPSMGANRVRNSVWADGAMISIGESVVLSTACAPIVVMTAPHKGFAVAARASQKSLLGDFRLGHGHCVGGSVIAKMVGKFHSTIRSSVKVFIIFSAGYVPCRVGGFRGKVGKKYWQRAMRFVRTNYGSRCLKSENSNLVSLATIVRSQCMRLGISPSNIECDGCDMSSDTMEKGGHWAFWFEPRGEDAHNSVMITMS